MTIAYYIKKYALLSDPRLLSLLKDLESMGISVYRVSGPSEVRSGTDYLFSLGGDGTFLTASEIAVRSGIPILGVNFGRLGFLSGADASSLASLIREGNLLVEERELLEFGIDVPGFEGVYPYALNELSVSRVSASMLGVDVEIDGAKLPTYWADGLLVATSSGSTAYNLSVGGPICVPEAKVFLLCPISPHNLNLRPLVIPQSSSLTLSFRSRDESVTLSLDNRNYTIPTGAKIEICAAKRKLQRVKVRNEQFINALRSRLYWGEDIRNE